MPEEGVKLTPSSDLLTKDEIIRLAKLFAFEGVNKIRLTGGEPTIRKGELSKIDGIQEIGITTNGIVLNRLIKPLIDAGLTNLNVSLDSLSAQKYAEKTKSELTGNRRKYCMPEEGVKLTPSSDLLTKDEIIRLARLFAFEGVNKIRLTGGEPTIRKGELSKIDGIQEIGITTNGIVLNRMIKPLIDAGLTNLNVSLDSLSAQKYAEITRRDGFQKVWRGLILSEQLMPKGKVKINCVVIRGINEKEVISLVEIGRELSFNIRFIEFMPFAGNNYEMKKFVSYREMLENIGEYYGVENIERLTDGPNETSKSYQVKGFVGKFGFISSMSEHFCGGADNQKLLEMIGKAVQRKAARHAGLEKLIQMADTLPVNLPRFYSTYKKDEENILFTHIDEKSGDAIMVDVGSKPPSFERIAIARAIINFPFGILDNLLENKNKKGDIFAVSRIAGILAAKQTFQLIPLCHQIPLTSIRIYFKIDRSNNKIIVLSRVKAVEAKTGVEMEAMVGCSLAALTIYDMTKSASLGIKIESIELLGKKGGKRDFGQTEIEENEEGEFI
uniref:Radical SAM core domain-containing protein n=1 Tax=Meloidogyne floridensis TaxID=298350 RepID=A0A915PB05_9BILA